MRYYALRTLIIIPAFNEAESLPRVIDDIQSNCPGVDYIIINDGSSDDTEALCRASSWPVLNLPVNLGLAGAFQAGMRFAWEKGYNAVLQLDGDGQHAASDAAGMISAMSSGDWDVLIGSRFAEEKRPGTMRMFGNALLSFAVRLTTGQKLTDPTSGMRIYNSRMVGLLANNINYGPEPDTIAFLIRSGAKVGEMQVTMRERMAGSSYLTALKSAKYMLNMFVSILFIQFFRRESI